MFSSFHLKSKMDPPATTTTTDNNNNNNNNNNNTPWEMTDSPDTVLVDGKLTYENVKEDAAHDCDEAEPFRFGIAENEASKEDLQESGTVFQETKMQASMEASTGSMPALKEHAVHFVAPAPSSTTRAAPDSPVSLPSVPSIDLSVKASDIDMDDLSFGDLVSPPVSPLHVRDAKRPRIHVETVTDDEDGGDYMDQDEEEYALEHHPAAAANSAASATTVPQVVVTNMFEPAAAAVLPIEIATETTPPAADEPATTDSVKRSRHTWMNLIGGLAAVVFTVGAFVAFPNVPAASVSHEAVQVLVPDVVTTLNAATLIVEPVVLSILMEAQQEEQEEVESETTPDLAEVIADSEDTLDMDIMFDLDAKFNLTSTLLFEEDEEEGLPTKAVLTVAAPEAPPAALLIAMAEETIIQDTVVAPEAPPAALLIAEETITQESIVRETVLEPPPVAKQESVLWNIFFVILAAVFMGVSSISRKQGSSRPGQVRGMLQNHAELARFLEGTSLMKKTGRKCRSPVKIRSWSSGNKDDDINSSYDGFTVEDLKMILDGFNGCISGNKADLIYTLVQCYREDLSGFKNTELQELLAIKGLHQSGKKQEMVDRLVKAGF